MNRRNPGSAAAIALFLLIFPMQLTSAQGQDATADSVTHNSIHDVQMTALKDLQNARIWWYGWLGGYSAATAGQVVVAATSDNLGVRQDMALGAATTFIGALGQLIMPIVPKKLKTDYPSYRDYIEGEKPLSEEQAAELLKILALREKEGRSWKMHAAAGAVNLGSGLVTWLGFKRTVWDGLLIFALNTAVTEAQIWTQPTRAIKDYERYLREGNPEAGQAPSRPASEWTVIVIPGGMALRVDF